MTSGAVFHLLTGFAGGIAVAFMLLWSRRYFSRDGFRPAPEILCALIAVAGALASVLPLLGEKVVGSGDAYHYALQAADFSTQVRRGIFPVLIGQSPYAFNGNIHTLRTAPYYVHLCGLIDLIAQGQLTAFRIEALAAILSALGGAVGLWLAVRSFVTRARLIPALLAILYVTAPGIAGALFGRDMYATYMTLPWIPLVILAAAQCLDRDRPIAPLMLMTGALAVVWYAHPPTAALLSPFAAAVVVYRLIRGPDRTVFLVAAVPVAASFVILVSYLFYSVAAMQLSYRTGGAAQDGESVYTVLPRLWPGLLKPIQLTGGDLTDMQPGYCVFALGLVLLVSVRRMSAALGLLAVAWVGYLVAFIPNPLTHWAWRHVPVPVISVVNPDPAQRILPVFTAIAVIGGGLILARLRLTLKSSILLSVLLVGGIAWNLTQLRHFDPAPQPDAHGDQLIRANVSLTRSSYLLFGSFPDTFSNAPTDPQQETRLVDGAFRTVQDDSRFITARPEDVKEPWLSTARQQSIPISPGVAYAIQFRFTHPELGGWILIATGLTHRFYALPLSGLSRSFGSAPGATKVLFVQPEDHDGKLLEVSCPVPGTEIRVIPFLAESLPVHLLSLLPFTVKVRNHGAEYLELPKVMIPGYAATVNGQPVELTRSPQGLVAVPLPPGESTVQVRYPGPAHLRQVYFLAFVSMLLWWIGTGLAYRWETKPETVSRPLRLIAIGATCLLIAAIPLTAIAIAPPADALERAPMTSSPTANLLRMTITMPEAGHAPSEPLVAIGPTGRADVIALRYVGTNQFELLYDHWAVGGPTSPRMTYTPGQSLNFEFHLPALMDPHARTRDQMVTQVVVSGQTLLEGELPWYPNPSSPVYIGLNPIGASSCSSEFSGQIGHVHFGRGQP